MVETEADADKEIDDYHKEVKARGEWWARMPEIERESVQAVCNQIRVARLTLSRVWEDFKRWKTENAQTAIEAMPYAKAIDKWKDRKLAAGKSEEYVNEAASVLMRFGEGQEQRNLHEITATELQEWLNLQMKPEHGGPKTGTWGLSSKKTNTSLFSSLWEVGEDLGWCSVNIVNRLEPVQRAGSNGQNLHERTGEKPIGGDDQRRGHKTCSAVSRIGSFWMHEA